MSALFKKRNKISESDSGPDTDLNRTIFDIESAITPRKQEIKLPDVETVSLPNTKDLKLREKTRSWIVFTLIGCIIGFVVILLISDKSITDKNWNLVDKVLTSFIGLLGTAIAFYFRSKE